MAIALSNNLVNPNYKYIFVSHSSLDWERVRIVRNFLEEKSFYPLLFHLKCIESTGEDLILLKELLHREIMSRTRFLYCDSDNARNSDYVQWEVKEAKDCSIPIIKTINIDEKFEIIQSQLSEWTTFLISIGFIGTWKSRIIRTAIIARLKEMDTSTRIIEFEDDEHIPVFYGQLPQAAIDYIKQQASLLDKTSLIVSFVSDDFYVRGFCGKVEYIVGQRLRLPNIQIRIPESQVQSPSDDFIEEIMKTIASRYFT